MLYASCMPSATSSTFHLYRVSWAALHPHCHTTSHSCHAFTVLTSTIQLFLFPEASLCPHLFTRCASHMLSVACSATHLFFVFSRASAHPFLFTFHVMCLMCLMPHQLPFIFSPLLRHPSIPIFSHSMQFMWLPTICTTIQQQLQPATLTIFPSRRFLCCSFSYFLSSVLFH